jgi:hypothetical protein
MAEQGSIDDTGLIVKKRCVTHDQSKPGPSGLSVNKCVIASPMTARMFGFCLKRIIHYIFSLRQRYPTKHVLVGKYDWKSAYRHAHLRGHTLCESITHVNGFLVAFLRMPFGSKPCPSQWSNISEMACDMTNALTQTIHGPPARFALRSLICFPTLNSLTVSFLSPRPDQCQSMFLATITADNYIDDMTPACVDINDNAELCAAAAALVFDFLSRSLDTNAPLTREVLLSMVKIMGGGRFQETKTVLGWTLDTRRLFVSLSSDKFSLWSSLLAPELETLVRLL